MPPINGLQAYQLAYTRYAQAKLMYAVSPTNRETESVLLEANYWLDHAMKDKTYAPDRIIGLRKSIAVLYLDINASTLALDLEAEDYESE
jgi:class 3 adenylate cyclase